ncbi:MAG: hypothetical protein IK130_06230 [Oscillospiraceae bacterium]|nr:hypothetical protein [Oscillospiraceae bacterium]
MKTSKRITVLLAAAVLALPMASCAHGTVDDPGTTGTTGTASTGTTRDMSSEAAALESQITIGPQGDIDAGLFFVDNPNSADNPLYGTEPPVVTTMIGEDGKAYVAKTDINGTNVTQADGALATELFTGTVVSASYVEDYVPDMKTYLSMWIDTSKRDDYKFDGEFLVYEIKVKDDAKDGVYPIDFYHLDFANYAGDTLPAYSNYGYICINSSKPSSETKLDGLTLVPEIVEAKPGDTIQYKVNIAQNPGICGFVLRMHYDSKAFEVKKGTNGKDFDIKSRISGRDAS